MRAVPLTTRAKRSAISCRCELNVSIQINKGSSYRMVAYGVLHNPGAVCELCLHQLALRAVWPALCLNASSIWLSPLPVLARSLSLYLPSESFALLRRMFSSHKVRQHDVVVAIVVRQAARTNHPPPSPLCLI